MIYAVKTIFQNYKTNFKCSLKRAILFIEVHFLWIVVNVGIWIVWTKWGGWNTGFFRISESIFTEGRSWFLLMICNASWVLPKTISKFIKIWYVTSLWNNRHISQNSTISKFLKMQMETFFPPYTHLFYLKGTIASKYE